MNEGEQDPLRLATELVYEDGIGFDESTDPNYLMVALLLSMANDLRKIRELAEKKHRLRVQDGLEGQ